MSNVKLAIQSWKKNVIYLVQFSRAACIPSVSPFSFKLETFLKFVGLPYFVSKLKNHFHKCHVIFRMWTMK